MKPLNISCLENLVNESKQFLEGLKVLSKPNEKVGLVVEVSDNRGNTNQVMLYQKDSYVILSPEGENALMYGNWEEALHATQRKIAIATQQPTLVLNHYVNQ